MVTVHGEDVRVEMLTERGWQDITSLTESVEVKALGEPFDGAGWAAKDLEIEVVIDDLRECVETASGKFIAARPRTET